MILFHIQIARCRDDAGERTTSEVAERQEGVHDVTQEVEFPQQVSAVASGLGEHLATLPVRSAELLVADVSDVHQEVEDVPQSASCRVRGQKTLYL